MITIADKYGNVREQATEANRREETPHGLTGNQIEGATQISKICTRCHIYRSDFSRAPHHADGLASHCKKCKREYSNKLNATQARKARLKVYSIRQDVKIKAKLYGQTMRAKASKNKAHRTTSKYSAFIRYANRTGRYVNIDKSTYVLLTSSPCYYCGGTLPQTGCGLDRKDNDLDYTVDNVLPCCTICNSVRNRFFSVQEMERIGALIRVIIDGRST